MARPTINDLAKAAGVSVSTVNRIVGGVGSVRQATMRRVRDAAAEIGFYGLGSIENRLGAARPKYRFGVLLQQPTRTFYQNLAQALRSAAERLTDCDVDLQIEFLEELSPQNIAARMLALGEKCAAIGVVAAVHPLVTQAVETLQQRGIPVFALISQLAATGNVHYVGLDNWKVGRTAAWAVERICAAPGKLGILVGNHRYRCQEMNESGFRSYFREYAPAFTLLEPLTTFESSAVAEEMTERLLRENPDLAGLYVAGGGISGALAALRASDRAGKIVVVGYQLMDNTRAALLDGTLTLVISHPLTHLSDELVQGMISASNDRSKGRTYTCVLPFDIYTRENI
ncbi:LacI family DNA-binding transcriptional regulator [Methylocapsa sp. S129]|uniref:LacI family DNA-binding transcriptional regulator n=1 Tax=Methylocapsa sp. S129 TaxID=1641869 RepID=UPI00131DD102|nr:LacI family DNA-binding transcriptional regulator [Methylocapsa sp. S129]